MFDGLNHNRAQWNAQAEVYNAKMKLIEDEKKKLEEDEAKKGTGNQPLCIAPVDGVIEDQETHPVLILLLCFCVCV